MAGTVHLAAERVRDKLARIVAPQFGCTPAEVVFEDGRIARKGAPESGLPFTRMASNAPHWSPQQLLSITNSANGDRYIR